MDKPLLIFDGDCGFCRFWIERWKSLTGDKVDYAPYQEVQTQFPSISKEACEQAVQLVLPAGKIYSAAEAVFRTLAFAGRARITLWLYQNFSGFRVLTEGFYSLVARHRVLFSRITRFIWGNHSEAPAYIFVREIFIFCLKN